MEGTSKKKLTGIKANWYYLKIIESSKQENMLSINRLSVISLILFDFFSVKNIHLKCDIFYHCD